MSIENQAESGALPNEKLRQSLLEYQAILENASVGILFTRERKVFHCNRRFSEMFGWQHGELAEQPTLLFYPSEESFREMGQLATPILTSGQLLDVEWMMRRKDGSLFWCRIRGKAVDPSDSSRGTIWITEDITERKNAQQSLNRILLEQQAILDNATVGIAFVQNRIIKRCNRRLEEILGYGRGELANQPGKVLFPSEKDYLEFGKIYVETPPGEIYENEHLFKKKDGTLFWCKVVGRAFDATDPQRGWIWIYEDVTERRRDREALARARDELELRVRERTAQLEAANARLEAEAKERKQAEGRVHQLANHDALTGLPNRRLLADRLAQALALAHRNQKKVAVMFIDLDRFKTINDSLGHRTGDRLLQHVARRLTGVLREGDTVSRLGGDEFVVILPEVASAGDAAVVADKIMEILAPPFSIGGHELHITPSMGISLYPNDGKTVETLIRNADAAMYHAKEMGRANYQFFVPQMNVRAAERLQTENDLYRALDRDELALYFQPKIDLASGLICGTEALLRWRHPERGLVAPDNFIPLAEETGLIVPIGEWALKEACRKAKGWQALGLPPLPVAVNLSARQFRQKNLVDKVSQVLTETGLEPGLLELEITETTLMQHTGDNLAVLDKLYALGVKFSIDDFGTGYSSLSYLKRFPVDELKIDRSFVGDIPHDSDDAAIVSAIIALARSLNLQVVAEGVETEDQLAYLARAGCHQAQGYYFSRPLPEDQMLALLEVEFSKPGEKRRKKRPARTARNLPRVESR